MIYARHLIQTYNWDMSCPNSPGGSIHPVTSLLISNKAIACDCIKISAGSIFDISKYRDTCKSSILIFSGIAILRYVLYRTPTVRYL